MPRRGRSPPDRAIDECGARDAHDEDRDRDNTPGGAPEDPVAEPTEAPPEVKGATATAQTKPATLETGLV